MGTSFPTRLGGCEALKVSPSQVLGPGQGISQSSPAGVTIIIVMTITSSYDSKGHPCLEPRLSVLPLFPCSPRSLFLVHL